ncbi:GNAT family N-acetyltransferase [Rhizobium sp. S152]|uniref:GNAT family N-acetyltransferase n=1 Tax=Rhizobium sp. S152 TaxID=3055038 RepID=UPI0025A986BE|nr:GNAT family N-acetyltransferase [Rhizobium sp. S152]MDM9625514.1 GNAT family N-acetyltransferase [Rhizobium sp. S152]
MSVHFRAITPDEAAGSAEIIVQAYAEPPWFEQWSIENAVARLNEMTTTPGCLTIGAVLEDSLIGFGFALPHTTVAGRGLMVAEIAIMPPYQRKGLGSALLRHIEREARAADYLHVWLVSQRDGGVADYYRGNGYTQSSKLGIYTKLLR